MTVTRVLVIFAIGWVGKNAAFAQPGTFGPICAGVQSIGWCHQFSPALPSAMAVGADGTTYVATAQRVDGGFVTAVSPNGAVIYETTFKRSVNALAPGRNGTLWVIAESLFQVDSQGHATAISSPYNTANTYYACSDAAGNLYVAAFVQPGGNSIAKLNPAGTLVGMFPIAAYGSPRACRSIHWERYTSSVFPPARSNLQQVPSKQLGLSRYIA